MAVQEHAYYGSFGYHVTNFFGASSRWVAEGNSAGGDSVGVWGCVGLLREHGRAGGVVLYVAVALCSLPHVSLPLLGRQSVGCICTRLCGKLISTHP